MIDNRKIVLHVGCGPAQNDTLCNLFKSEDWREIRLDIDPRVNPDIVASLTDLRAVPSNSVDAIWSSHNVEHLLPHEVSIAFSEFLRVLKPEGFALIVVPDLQKAAELVVADRLDDPAYKTGGGDEITPFDMIYGWRKEILTGNEFYCHRTGFTAKTLYWALVSSGYGEVLVQRDSFFQIWATAYKHRPSDPKPLPGLDVYVPLENDAKITGYKYWQKQHEQTAWHKTLCERRMAGWYQSPQFQLVVLLNRNDDMALAGTINSLVQQYLMPANVTVIAPFPPLTGWESGSRLNWREMSDGATAGEMLREANNVMLYAEADWIFLANAGDLFPPHAFFSFAEAIHSHPEWRIIYSDEDRINQKGDHDLPHFKSDFNPALLRGYPYIGGLLAIQKSAFEQVGGFHAEYAGVEEFDIALRTLELFGGDVFGHVPDILYHRLDVGGHSRLPVEQLVNRGKLALEAHLRRQSIAAEVVDGYFPASYRVRYQASQDRSASVLIYIGNAPLERLQRCIEGILSATAWSSYELILLADSTCTVGVSDFVAALETIGNPKLRTIALNESLTWSEAHNKLASSSLGDSLVFFSPLAVPLQPDWLEELLARADQQNVAAVAPRLLSADGKVYRGGDVFGLNNRPVGTPFQNQSIDYPGYYGRALLAQNFSTLPATCLVVRRDRFFDAGGFDSGFEAELAAADLCLRISRRGGYLEWTPFTNVLVDIDSGQDDQGSWTTFYERWLARMVNDRTYNPNLSLRHEFAVETLGCLSYNPIVWKPLPRILTMPADDSGSGEYRVTAPARVLRQTFIAETIESRSTLSPVEMERIDPDVLVMQRQIYEHQIEAIRRYSRFGKAFRVYELDDLITDMPEKSALRPFMPQDAGHWMAEALAMCHRFVVSSPGLAEAYRHLHRDIRVVPNYLERSRWVRFSPKRQVGRKPRVGWAGGNSHSGDLDVISEVVKTLANEVEWVFLGMTTDQMRPFLHENHSPVSLEAYPAKLASLNLDLALAPLERHHFNECKSHLKLLEYGVLGYPVIATDIRPYQGDYPITRVGDSVSDWIDAIRWHLADSTRNAQAGDALRNYVLSHWLLDDHLDLWKTAWLP
jgi:GT2 family glycosyltransferase